MNANANGENDGENFRRESRRILFAWIALIALLLASLGSSYLSLGIFNSVLSIGIAFVKTAIVVWLFMRMNRAATLIRLAAASGLGALALLAGIVGVDYATRASEPAPMQTPRQIAPLLEEREK